MFRTGLGVGNCGSGLPLQEHTNILSEGLQVTVHTPYVLPNQSAATAICCSFFLRGTSTRAINSKRVKKITLLIVFIYEPRHEKNMFMPNTQKK